MSATSLQAGIEVDIPGDATYIQTGENPVSRTHRHVGTVHLDLDAEGYVVGIEFLAALRFREVTR